MNQGIFFPPQLMSKETMAPFGAELSGDLEQQVRVIITQEPFIDRIVTSLCEIIQLCEFWDALKCAVCGVFKIKTSHNIFTAAM